MLVSAVAFQQLVLAVHILGVVVGFGVTFAYPIFFGVGSRLEPSAMPWFFRMMQLVTRQLVYPGLLIVLVCGIYLASKEDQFHAFYVQWGMFAVIAIGAIEGGVMAPRVRKLIEVSARDLAATPAGAQGRRAPFRSVPTTGRRSGSCRSPAPSRRRSSCSRCSSWPRTPGPDGSTCSSTAGWRDPAAPSDRRRTAAARRVTAGVQSPGGEGVPAERTKPDGMSDHQASRTLVKSAPELWAECSEPASLARHLGAFGEIRITKLQPETAVVWEGDAARGTVRLEPSGWGTRVVLTAGRHAPARAPVQDPAAERDGETELEVVEVPAAPHRGRLSRILLRWSRRDRARSPRPSPPSRSPGPSPKPSPSTAPARRPATLSTRRWTASAARTTGRTRAPDPRVERIDSRA